MNHKLITFRFSTTILVFMGMVVFHAFVSAQNLQWIGTNNQITNSIGNTVVIDKNNAIYTAGTFQDTVIFGSDTMISRGYEDIFLLKCDFTGKPVWLKSIGSRKKDLVNDITIDQNGNILIAGGVNDSLFVGDTVYVTNSPNQTLFISYFNSSGIPIKTLCMKNSFFSMIHDMEVEEDNSLVITGEFNGTLQKDNVNLLNKDGKSFFLIKLDSLGIFIWGRQSKGQGTFGKQVISDLNGYYVTGAYEDKAIFDSIQLFAHTSIYHSLFVAMYSTNGKLKWIRSQTGTQEAHGCGIAMNNQGHLLVAGEFMGKLDSFPMGSLGGYDILLLQYDKQGKLLWYKQQGGANNDYPNSIVSSGKKFIVCGIFNGQSDFKDTMVYSKGINAGFIYQLNDAGKMTWFRQLGGTATVNNRSTFYKDKMLAVTGVFFNDIIADRPGYPDDTLYSSGFNQFFTALLHDVVLDSKTIIPEVKVKEDFVIYPNPANEVVYLKFSEQLSHVDITVHDVFGRLMQEEKVEMRTWPGMPFELNKMIGNGVYLFSVKSRDGKGYSKKIIVNKK